jgi:type I restriction enzyme, S subunit
MNSEWKEVRLKKLIDKIGDGGTPSTLNQNNFGGEIPWVVIEDIRPEIYDTKTKLTEIGLRSCSAKLWPIDSVILSTGATIGEVGVAKVPLCTKQGITGLVCNKFANNYFLKFWFESNRNTLLRYSQGTTFKEIRPRPLGNLRINIPSPFTKESLIEQKAIAGILSKVDEAIEVVENSIKAAERLKKSLMQNLLTGKLKPDGTMRSEDEFYVDEKFGKVPKGWELKKLKHVCGSSGEYGANASAIAYREGIPRFIRITDIDDFGNLIEENKAGIEVDKSKNYILKENDFLFARTGDTVGKSLLYKDSMGLSAFAGYLIKFTFLPDVILPEYFDLVAKSDLFEAFKIAMKRVGAKPNINSREYGSFRFILPNGLKDQEAIIKKVTPLNSFTKTNHKKIQSLKTLKKSLMQNLLTGKVRVDVEKINKLLEMAE